MPDKTIPELTGAGALTGTESFHIVQNGNSRELTLDDLAAYIKTAESIVPSNLPHRGARVKRTSDQTGITWPIVASWQEEDFDTDGFWSLGDPTKFVIPGGVSKVRLQTNIIFELMAARGSVFATIRKNSTGVAHAPVPIPNLQIGGSRDDSGFGTNQVNVTTGVLSVVPGDWFDVRLNTLMTGQDQFIATSDGSISFFELEVIEGN